MADIAFLLLIFFLVTTNINQDYAIKTNISKPFEVPDSLQLITTSLLVNEAGKYMLNSEEILFKDIHKRLAHSMNMHVWIKNVVVVKSDREVSYADF
jgi:biopolymer transport protein ExbD